jgi:PAS domain S-box-containing protein
VKGEDKTPEQLAEELKRLRMRAAELEGADARHRRTEQALRQSQERLKLAVEGSRGGLWDMVFDLDVHADFTPERMYLSPRVRELTGCVADGEMDLQTAWNSRIHPEDHERMRLSGLEHLRGDTEHHEAIFRVLQEDGSVRWIHSRGRIQRDERGRPVRWTGIDWDVTELKRAEERLLAYQKQLQSLAAELSLAEERERRELASALHDKVGQLLGLSAMKLAALAESASSPEINAAAAEVEGLVAEATQATQSLMFELSSPVLHELGLVPAAQSLAENMRQQHGLTVELSCQRQGELLSEEVRVFLFRALRELLLNVVKHAQTSKAEVSIERSPSRVRVSVQDNGAGFDPAAAEERWQPGGGFGLFSLRERARHLGGSLTIESEPGGGTTAKLELRLDQQDSTEEV